MHRILGALAGLDALDPVGEKLGELVRAATKPRPLKEALSGTWLGHPVHPLLTDATIGTFSSALLLDWLGGEDSRPAARRLIGIGLLSAAPVVASGASDWGDAEPADDSVRRIGILHATSNALATTLFAASYAARRRGGDGRLLALAGGAALSAGGYLGGHLAFAEGIGVDHTVFEDDAEGWTDVLAESTLADGKPRCVEAEGTAVMVVRRQGTLFALSDHCSHLGGPLHEGTVTDTTVTCPLHESVFELRDGSLVHGPAAYPQPVWETRVRAGRVEVRRR
jgi:nitrite reductase/ring-hydroxylating ferredoxin subunit